MATHKARGEGVGYKLLIRVNNVESEFQYQGDNVKNIITNHQIRPKGHFVMAPITAPNYYPFSVPLIMEFNVCVPGSGGGTATRVRPTSGMGTLTEGAHPQGAY